VGGLSYTPIKLADIAAAPLQVIQSEAVSIPAGDTKTVSISVPTNKVLIVKKITVEGSGADIKIASVAVDGAAASPSGVDLGATSYDFEEAFGAKALARSSVSIVASNGGADAEDAYLNVYALVVDEVYAAKREAY
jgi:hypothetical protein